MHCYELLYSYTYVLIHRYNGTYSDKYCVWYIVPSAPNLRDQAPAENKYNIYKSYLHFDKCWRVGNGTNYTGWSKKLAALTKNILITP